MNNTLFSPEIRQFALKVVILLSIALGIWLVYSLRSLLEIFGGAVFIALLLSPCVNYFRRWHIGRWYANEVTAILLTFATVLVSLLLFVLATIPIFIDIVNNSRTAIRRGYEIVLMQAQLNFPWLDALPMGLGTIVRDQMNIGIVRDLITRQEGAIANVNITTVQVVQDFLQKGFGQASMLGLSFASGVTSMLAFFMLFLLVTFFVILERKTLLQWFFRTLPESLGTYFRHRQREVGGAIHAWLKGQFTLALYMSILNLVGLYIVAWFGVPVQNILALALIAGVMEFVPYAGPILAWLAAFVMVLVHPDSTFTSIIIITILYIIFQFIEGNIMVPRIMSRTMNLSALYILLMTLAGAALGGIPGVLISLPLASVLHIFYNDWMHYRRTMAATPESIPEKVPSQDLQITEK